MKPTLPPFEFVKNNKHNIHLKCVAKLDDFINRLNTSFDKKLADGNYTTFENKRFWRQNEYGIEVKSNIVNYGSAFSCQIFGEYSEEQEHFWGNQKLYLDYILKNVKIHLQRYIDQYNDFYKDSEVSLGMTVSEDFRDYKVYFTYRMKEEYRD